MLESWGLGNVPAFKSPAIFCNSLKDSSTLSLIRCTKESIHHTFRKRAILRDGHYFIVVEVLQIIDEEPDLLNRVMLIHVVL